MANRYWVGGTGTWDGTSTANWSASSGGATGASVPTAADNVFFDVNSNVGTGAFTVTMATTPRVCNDFTASGLDGVMTLAGTSIGLTVSGSLTFQATNFTRTYDGVTTFNATTTGKTVTTNGVTFGGSAVTFDGVGGGWTLGSALTCGTITVTNGTFSTSASNYAVTATIFNSSNSNARTINLNASTISLSNSNFVLFTTSTNLTLNAGTSTINGSNVSATFSGGGLTYYNVSFTSTAITTASITGANTFNNLSVTGPTATGVANLTFAANQTISGALTTTGTAGNRRVFFASATYGIGFTLTCNSAASLTDADFRDIYVIGTAAPISGTRIGNRGNNSGITFDVAKTVYWNLAGANQWWVDNGWCSSSGGTPSTNNFPLPQDTAIFDNSSAGATITIPASNPYISGVSFASRTTLYTFNITGSTTCYGSITCSSAIFLGAAGTVTMSGGGVQTITSAGKTFGPIIVDTYGGTVQLADALSTGSSNLTITNGTFDTSSAGNYAVTAVSIFSNNSNVRTINFNASTFTLSGFIVFTTSTNLTFNAGTSTINSSSTAPTFNGGGQTFYNVSFNGTAIFSGSITGANTFNNLSIAGRTTIGIAPISIGGNQTINGTFTVNAGTASAYRTLFYSSVFGTQRTLTVNAFAAGASDIDFTDISIAGTASPISGTRFSDTGGNSGITFPAAKTVYYRQTGSSNWGTASPGSWSLTSGGAFDDTAFPLAQDTAVFPAATYPAFGQTTSLNANYNIGTIDMSLRTGNTMTFDTSVAGFASVYGNWINGTGITLTPTTLGVINTVYFNGRTTQTITSAGRTFYDITVDNLTGTVQLADALSTGLTTGAVGLTLSSGTFDAVSYNVTTISVSSITSGTLKMGSGTWTLSGSTTTPWKASGTLISGTATIVLSTSSSTRSFAGGGLYYNKLTLGSATISQTTTVTGANTFGELASTKTIAHTIAFGANTQTFGKWSVTGTVGNVVTLTGTSTTNVIAGPAVTGVDYLAMGTWGVSTTSPGEFYAGANSTGTAAAPVFRTTAPAPRTLYWVGGTGNWSSTTKWATSSGGASGAAIPTSLDTVTFDALSNATAYTATIDAGVTLARCASFTMAGPLVGNVTWAGTVGIAFQGNVSFAATGITRSYTGAMNWAGNASYTFTTNGLTLSNTTTINGIGATWTLGSGFILGLGINFTVTNGTFDTSSVGNYAFTVNNQFLSTNSNVRTINFNASTVNIGSNIPVDFSTSTNLTFNAGTSLMSFSSSGNLQFDGGGLTYYNVAWTTANLTSLTINGANTYNNLSFTGRTTIGIQFVTVAANQTINGTFTVSAGTAAAYRIGFSSNGLGTPRTFTCAAVSLTDVDFRDITIAGAAAPASGTRLGDAKGNSGITFDAAKTVYFGSTGSVSWGRASTGSWSATSGGALDATQFPLAQDTAVFPAATYPASGSTTTIQSNYYIGTIDMSLRTSNTMTLATSTNFPLICGNWINGTGITLSGTSAITFLGRTTQTITSAAKTFTQPITINSPNGSVTLQDALTTASVATTLTNGTLDLNNFTLSTGTFSSSGSSTRTLTFGSSTISLAGTGTVWDMSTSTNATINKGTGTISLTDTSTTARTFAGGGLSYPKLSIGGTTGVSTLTFSGNNTFPEIASTKTVAHTISLAATTQTVGAWTAAGTVGNLLTITGTSAASAATLIYTGAGAVSGLNYLVPTFVRAYSTTSTWYAGANSTNGGSLGWIFTASAGNIYAVYIVESNTVSDAITSTAVFKSAITNTATATDSILGGFVYVSAVADSATATDSFLVAPSTFNAPIAETATATDSPSVAASTFNAPVTNTTTATDNFLVAPSTFNAPVTNTATATDSILGLAAFSSALSETATATDSILGGLLFVSAVTNTATATESLLGLAAFSSALSETATATDNFLVAPSTFNAPVTNTATATDTFLIAPSTFNAPVTNTATITDVITNAGSIYNAPVTNTATITDAITSTAVFIGAITDTATITDVFLVAPSTFNAPVANSATATDSFLVAPSTFNAPFVDTATITDVITNAGSIYNAPVFNTATATDVFIGSFLWNLIDDSQTITWTPIPTDTPTTWNLIDDSQTITWTPIPTDTPTTWDLVDDTTPTTWQNINNVN